MTPCQPCEFTRLQCMWLLRKTRAARDLISTDKIAAEERLRGGVNEPGLSEAARILDAEQMIAEEVIAILWRSCGV